MRIFFFVLAIVLSHSNLKAQGCCSGASGNPIAGGSSTGVLLKNQIELAVNYQYNFSDKFYAGNNDTVGPTSFSNLNSNYVFLSTNYGLSKNTTLSISSGYFINKTKNGNSESQNSNIKGFSDIIIFPKYNIYNKDRPFSRAEATIGIGIKIPIGSHTDSIQYTPTGPWEIKPPITQLSSGANDLILYSFLLKEYKLNKMRVFANFLHIKKGFNSYGSKIGDYTSYAVFFGKTFNNKISSTIQIKQELIKKMIVGTAEDPYGLGEAYVASSGSNKIFIIPQISYSLNSLSVFASYELPIYQYINGLQIGSKNQFSIGLNYRFLTKKIKSIDD